MTHPIHIQVLGQTVTCASVADVQDLIQRHGTQPQIQSQAAAYGMALAASLAAQQVAGRNDGRQVLDEMARAKASIDIASWHCLEVVQATSAVLLAVQTHWDEEYAVWDAADPEDIATFALQAAERTITSYGEALALEKKAAAGSSPFLADKLANYGLVQAEIIGSPAPQTFTARVKRVYAAREGVRAEWAGSEITFVGCPPTWGQVALAVGETALVFLSAQSSGRVHEDAWRGHLVIEEIDGEAYATYQRQELWLSTEIPEWFSKCVRPDPKRNGFSAIRLDALEAYLSTLIEPTQGKGGRSARWLSWLDF